MVRDSRKAVGGEDVEWGADIIEAEIRVRIRGMIQAIVEVGSSRVDLQACKLEYSIVSPK